MPTSTSESAPTSSPAPVAPEGTTGHANHYILPHGVTPAFTRSQVTISRQNLTPTVTGNQGKNGNTSAAIADLFRADARSHPTNWDSPALKHATLHISWTTEARFLPKTPMPRQICRKAICEGEKITNLKQRGDEYHESSALEGSSR